MKSIKAAGVAIVFFSAYAFGGPSLLVGGGVNLSSTTAVDSLSAAKSPRQGFNVACGFEQTLTNGISLVSGLSIETRGERTKSATEIGDSTSSIISAIQSDIDLLYLQIPLLIQYNIRLGRGTLNLFAGPEMGILLSGELKSVDNTTIPNAGISLPPRYDTADLAPRMRMADGGISGGIGYEFAFGRSALVFRPSYYYGLTDYFRKGPRGVLSNGKLFLGYKIDFLE